MTPPLEVNPKNYCRSSTYMQCLLKKSEASFQHCSEKRGKKAEVISSDLEKGMPELIGKKTKIHIGECHCL